MSWGGNGFVEVTYKQNMMNSEMMSIENCKASKVQRFCQLLFCGVVVGLFTHLQP